MEIKGAIFDMDGLMLDTERLLMKFWIAAAREYGFDMKEENVLGIRSLAAKFAAPKLQSELGKDFDYYKVKKKRIELMNAYVREHGVDKKPGLDKLLDHLKINGFKIAVATATDMERTKMYLTSVGVWDYFDAVVCGPMVENGKPEPDIYLKASECLGLKPQECIALEDSPNGIKSAHSAGCYPIMIPDLSQPDAETSALLYRKFDRLDEVIDIL